ncbi:MAG: transcriptional regulator NrdR [bacterium]
MQCPHCNANNDKVLESRSLPGGTSIRRRRVCLECGYRFTSYEHIEEKQLMVRKRDGRREPFDRQKLERGLQTSLEKRPVSQLLIEEIVHYIEDEAAIRQAGTHEIDSAQIGEMVLEQLYQVDKVGYIRFASVYKMFEDVEAFKRELDAMFAQNGGEE